MEYNEFECKVNRLIMMVRPENIKNTRILIRVGDESREQFLVPVDVLTYLDRLGHGNRLDGTTLNSIHLLTFEEFVQVEVIKACSFRIHGRKFGCTTIN